MTSKSSLRRFMTHIRGRGRFSSRALSRSSGRRPGNTWTKSQQDCGYDAFLQVFSDESRVAGVIGSDTSLFLAAIRTDMTDDTVEPSRSVDPSVSDRYTGLPLGGTA